MSKRTIASIATGVIIAGATVVEVSTGASALTTAGIAPAASMPTKNPPRNPRRGLRSLFMRV